MSLVTDFLNSNIVAMSRFPGSVSYGEFADKGPEFHSDAVISMTESEDRDHEFVVLRFALFASPDGHLEANLRLIFDYYRGGDREQDEFSLPFYADASLVTTVRRYLVLHDVEEPLAGESLRLVQALDAMKEKFSDTILFQYPPATVSEPQGKRVFQ